MCVCNFVVITVSEYVENKDRKCITGCLIHLDKLYSKLVKKIPA